MPFEKIKLVDEAVTVLEAYDRIDFNELIEELISFYDEKPTLHCIWDFKNAALTSITNEDIHKLAAKSSEYSKCRRGGKTAFIANDSFTFGICRMAQLIATNNNTSLSINVFYSRAKALRWINSK